MKRVIAITTVVAALAIGGTVFAVTRGGDHMSMAQSDMSMTKSGQPMGQTMADEMPGAAMQKKNGAQGMGEQAFLVMMIAHHQMAVDMSEVIVERGKDPATMALARRVIADQKVEIADMTKWHKKWFGSAPSPTGMPGDGRGMMGGAMGMDDLRRSPEPDRTYLRMMIPHHAGAIMMADELLAGKPRPELEELGTSIIAAQAAEIGEMQTMRSRLAPPRG